MNGLQLLPVTDLPDIRAGDRIADLIAARASLMDGDVVVIASKIVAKAEDRTVAADREDDTTRDRLIAAESTRVLRRRGRLTITETTQGFVCANAGIDWSNVESGNAVLLPRDADRSARKLRDRLRAATNADIAVIVSDTFGRAWRNGVTDVALGCAGIKPILDLRGEHDSYRNELSVTQVCIVDELAAAAELVMGKSRRIPVVVVRGVDTEWLTDGADVKSAVLRKPADDLFR